MQLPSIGMNKNTCYISSRRYVLNKNDNIHKNEVKEEEIIDKLVRKQEIGLLWSRESYEESTI